MAGKRKINFTNKKLQEEWREKKRQFIFLQSWANKKLKNFFLNFVLFI